MEIDIVRQIHSSNKKFFNYINKRLYSLNIHDVDPSNLWLILHIDDAKDMNMKEIADFFHFSKANLSTVANRLIKKGYITKNCGAHNKKNLFLTLTPKGYQLKMSLKVILKDMRSHIKDCLTETEILELIRLLNILDNHIDNNLK